MVNELIKFDETSLSFVSFLGRGGSGSVSLMRDSKSQLYAKKSSPISHLEILEKELRIMLRFRTNPRIVQASTSLMHFNQASCYMFMEFASKGTLHNMISQFRGRPMPQDTIGRVSRMILQGLKDLHSHGYVHCDLKPANVLVFPSKAIGEPWDLKLADFGLSKEPYMDPRSLFGGTRQYMPPETLVPNRIIGPAFDIWSLGCVVLEMFGGCPVKTGGCHSWRLTERVPPLAEDFLSRCLDLQPSRRATATQLLNHPFVTQKVVSVPPQLTGMVPCVITEPFRGQGGPVMMMVQTLQRPGGFIC